MLISPEFDAFFGLTLRSLRGYLDQLICIGGCANALYRYHPNASPAFAPVMTMDIDFACPTSLSVQEKSIPEIMHAIGMKERLYGSENDAVIKYSPTESPIDPDIEFLCPAVRRRTTRGPETERASVPIQNGLTAQPLQYLELLFHEPWEIDLARVPGFEDDHGIIVKLPNPAAYVVQKVLIRTQARRSAEALAKDCFYIFEISMLFRDHFEALATAYTELAQQFHLNWFRRFEQAAFRLFRNENANGPVAACQIYRDFHSDAAEADDIDETRVSFAVRRMLETMFKVEAE